MTNPKKTLPSLIAGEFTVLIVFLFTAPAPALAHTGGPSIELERETVSAGSELDVRGTGYKGAGEITFRLRGTGGTERLTTEPVPGEDWNLTIDIPAESSPGTYQLIASGGGNEADAKFEINESRSDSRSPEAASTPAEAGQTEESAGDGEEDDTGTDSREPQQKQESEDELPPGGIEVVESQTRPGLLNGLLWAVVLIAVGSGGYLLGRSKN